MISEVLQAALEAIQKGESYALATVVEAEGSSPGKPGHKMILFADGRQKGTVGGGGLEQKVIEEALKMIPLGRGGIVSYTFDPSSPESIGMLCGGKATVAIEVVTPTTRILLCGGGHVAHAFARICVQLGYNYTVVDEREGLVTPERYPDAADLVAQSPPVFLESGALERYSHVVIFTHDHALDREALLAISRTGFSGYIGMIGSKRTWVEIQKSLKEAGTPESWIQRVHCPIGLDIGASTPVEIALSIAAEIIKELKSG